MRRGDCSRNRPAVFLTCFILRETLNKSFAAEWRIFYPICADRRNTGHNAPFSASGKFRLCPDSSTPHKGRCPLWGPRNGKYIQYSHILRTFSCGKISRHQHVKNPRSPGKASCLIFPYPVIRQKNRTAIVSPGIGMQWRSFSLCSRRGSFFVRRCRHHHPAGYHSPEKACYLPRMEFPLTAGGWILLAW